MRLPRTLLAALASTALLATGCASQSAPAGQGQAQSSPSAKKGHDHHQGMDMSKGGDMSGMDMSKTASGVSASAKMVCSKEIRQSVQQNLRLTTLPTPTSTFKKGVFTCTYDVPQGTLVLSVDDATDPKAGRQYFDGLRTELASAEPIKGVESFGLPSYQDNANVVFMRDGKTLRVDASGLPQRLKPYDFTRAHVAYAVAASVIACWTE